MCRHPPRNETVRRGLLSCSAPLERSPRAFRDAIHPCSPADEVRTRGREWSGGGHSERESRQKRVIRKVFANGFGRGLVGGLEEDYRLDGTERGRRSPEGNCHRICGEADGSERRKARWRRRNGPHRSSSGADLFRLKRVRPLALSAPAAPLYARSGSGSVRLSPAQCRFQRRDQRLQRPMA